MGGGGSTINPTVINSTFVLKPSHSVKLKYPEGLQHLIPMFRMCATARLFLDSMLPGVEAGIFLDTDTLLMDDIKVSSLLYLGKPSESKFFILRISGSISTSSVPVRCYYDECLIFLICIICYTYMLYCYTYTICYTYMTQVMGMAATENYYSAIGSLPYYGPPGVGLNAGVIMMNLTRMERMAGDGFTGAVRSRNTAQELLQSFFYTEKFIREETKKGKKCGKFQTKV